MDIIRSGSKVFIANLLTTILGFVGLSYFAHKLGASGLGVFFLFQSVIGILSIPTDFGIRDGVEKRISEGQAPGRIFSTAIAIKFILVFAISSPILLFKGFINNYIGANLATVLIITLLVREFDSLIIHVLKGELRVGTTAGLQLIRKVVWVVLGGLLISAGFEVHALIYSTLLGTVMTLLVGSYLVSTRPKIPSLKHARSLLDFSKYSFISSVGSHIYNWMDVIVVGFFLTQAHVGAYEVAWRITMAVLLLSNSIATTIFPQVSAWSGRDEFNKIENLIPKSLQASLFLVIPAFFGSLLFSREILGLIFGVEFSSAWLVLIILMADKVSGAIQAVIGRSLAAIDQPRLAARASGISVLLNLLLNIVLVWKFGLIGAAVATLLSSTIGDLLHAVYLSGYIKIEFPIDTVKWYMFASLIMSLTILPIKLFASVNQLQKLAVTILFGAVVYLTISLSSDRIRGMVWGAIQQELR